MTLNIITAIIALERLIVCIFFATGFCHCSGAELQKPLAIVVISSLITSTVPPCVSCPFFTVRWRKNV